jgi:hypothetical protein
MYGGGGGGGGWCGSAPGGKQGVVVIRYPGAVRATGGTITYNAADGKTYHVFTSSGTLTVTV